MDAVDVAILALRLALVLVLYGFLVAVLRTAAATIRQAPADPAAPKAVDGQSGTRARYAVEWSVLKLVVLAPGQSGLTPGAVIEVSDGARLGRASHVDVVVPDATISAEHARLSRLDGRWLVTDLGSTNGTRVNDQLVEREAALAPGDHLAFGNVHLQVMKR